jgi:hypothetical protein
MESIVKSLSLRRLLLLAIAAVCVFVSVPAPAGAVAPARSTFTQSSLGARRSASLPHLGYYGGRVLGHVRLDVVVWGSWSYGTTVPLTGRRSISSFLGGITNSKYLDWLSEYDTPTQHIGRGSLEGVYTIHPPRTADGARVTSAQIASVLRSMIGSGKIPKPTTSRMYVVFFRSGQTITTAFGNSAANFCAYHDTMAYGAATAYFAIIPYELQNRGCRPASTLFDDVTTIVSHELVEGITDPGVGLNRIAWYDRNNGEIADICAGISSPAAVTGGDGARYVVQREWSNRSKACVVSR